MVTEKQKANLKPPINKRSPEEQLAIRRKGQKAQQASLKEQKTVKACLLALMSMPIPDDKCEEYGFPKGTVYAAGMALSGAKGFLDGNPAMARLMLELLGESKQEVNINGALPVVIHDDID
ncbi:hypothetical protein [Selenomonas sp. AE3005]|uniref:hypothetical protein n=1 Tax=Selenomonas sp. AE3005 TaxID=1485543 RepID=UPI0025EF80E5|nr:hypothetical protein [Selenomonas sp. AE3005]